MNWKEKIQEKIVEILFGVVLVGLAGFVLREMYVLNANQSATNEKVSSAIGRIERIASALPDVRIRIAQEELSKPLQAAVVVEDPMETPGGLWIAPVHLFDVSAGQRRTYFVRVRGREDKKAAFLACGAALDLDNGAVSFASLTGWSAEVREPTALPGCVVASHSLALREPRRDYAAMFNDAMRSAWNDTVTEEVSVNLHGHTWSKLASELSSSAAMCTLQPGAVPQR